MATHIDNIGESDEKQEIWVVYLEHFKQFVTYNSIPEGQQVATFLIVIGSKALRWPVCKVGDKRVHSSLCKITAVIKTSVLPLQ